MERAEEKVREKRMKKRKREREMHREMVIGGGGKLIRKQSLCVLQEEKKCDCEKKSDNGVCVSVIV